MDRVAGFPFLQLLNRLAEVFQGLVVENFDFSLGI
jgi:hypothetical protein